MSRRHVRASKFLSLVLRHRPETIGVTLDPEGWVPIATLVERTRGRDLELTEELIRELVRENDKQRFAISSDGLSIRANQGHSVPVDLGLDPVVPPDELYHGTATRYLASIRVDGLRSRSRQHVHLSPDEETALNVGTRHGKPVILTVDARGMTEAGHVFYLSQNGVWLVSEVPREFLRFPE